MGRKRWEVGGDWHRGGNVVVGAKEQCVAGGREEAPVLIVDVTKVGMVVMESDKMFLVGLLVWRLAKGGLEEEV